jgi:hypothetical protein
MKDLAVGLVVTVILIAFFSSAGYQSDMDQTLGPVGKHPGDSGPVLPGGGSEQVAAVAAPEPRRPTEPDPTDQETAERKTTPAEAAQETQPTTEQEESETMNDSLLLIWNGVAAVLIGETMAIILATVVLKLATAWMKIKGDKDD